MNSSSKEGLELSEDISECSWAVVSWWLLLLMRRCRPCCTRLLNNCPLFLRDIKPRYLLVQSRHNHVQPVNLHVDISDSITELRLFLSPQPTADWIFTPRTSSRSQFFSCASYLLPNRPPTYVLPNRPSTHILHTIQTTTTIISTTFSYVGSLLAVSPDFGWQFLQSRCLPVTQPTGTAQHCGIEGMQATLPAP